MDQSRILALNEEADIYMVVDERGATLGTGTKETCEALVELTNSPAGAPSLYIIHEPIRSSATIRSAITI